MNLTPHSGQPTRRGHTLAQWLVVLSDYLPSAYVRAYSPHLESLWRDGCTPGEAWAYATAFLLAPRITPAGWEDVRSWGESENTGTNAGGNSSARTAPGSIALDTPTVTPFPSPTSDGMQRLLDDLDIDPRED